MLPPTDQHVTGRASTRTGTLQIDRDFNGQRRSANGGFAAGVIASRVDAETVTVVLRRPIRLGVPLDVFELGDDEIVVRDRTRVVAEGRPGALVAEGGPGALVAESRNGALVAEGHPGALVAEGRPGILASPWVVRPASAHAGIADFPAVWAAMDSPSYPASALASRIVCVLGTMTVRIERRPRVGEQLVVYGWTREHQGRRYETSVAMVDARGALVAQADASWIALKRQGLRRLAFHHLGRHSSATSQRVRSY